MRLLTAILLLPASLWYLVLLVLPLTIVLSSRSGPGRERWVRPAVHRSTTTSARLEQPDPFITSLTLAIGGTIGCLLVGLPLAYFLATRAGAQGAFFILLCHPVLDELPHPHLRLADDPGPERGPRRPRSGITGSCFRVLGTPFAVLLGLVYGYLPLMVFPLYVTLERMDRTLVEASKDLGAGRWATFRQITLPIALPGLVTGSILVFIPMMGEYVIPEILGYGRIFPWATRWSSTSSRRATGRPAPREPPVSSSSCS